MRLLFFVNTPFHAHIYRNPIQILSDKGHETMILARDHGCALDILDYHNLSYDVYGSVSNSRSVFYKFPLHAYNIVKKCREFNPDIIFGLGNGGYSMPGGIASGTPVITFWDGESGETVHSRPFKIQRKLYWRFRHAVISPSTSNTKLCDSHFHMSSPLELSYLHPNKFRESRNHFNSDKKVLLRFNSFSASHDIGVSGFTEQQRNDLVEELSTDCNVIVSDENKNTNFINELSDEFEYYEGPPAEFHQTIANVDLVISDGQTVIREAAIAGTPGIRMNSFVGLANEGTFIDLENSGLIHNVESFDEVVELSNKYLNNSDVQSEYIQSHKNYIDDLDDVTEIIIKVANNYENLESVPEIKLLE